MNKSIFLILIVICLSGFSKKPFTQVTHFDSVRVVVSSNVFDYRNPVFSYPSYLNYFQEVKLLYEVKSGTSSGIAWRNLNFWNYSNENFIVSNGFMNINSTSSNYMVVWQSNKNANWDLYFAIWNGSNWSVPAIIDSTAVAETKPCLYYSSYGYQTYYLTFERNNDIWFKYYRNGFWQGDTNLTSGISYDCFSPVYYEQRIYYMQKMSSVLNMLCCQKFGISYPGYNFIWYPVELHPKPNSVNNIHRSTEFHFEYDTLSGTHSYILDNHITFTIHNLTLGFSGRNTNCSGSQLLVPITENSFNDIYPYYTIFGFQRRTIDSNMIVAQSSINYDNIVTKYFNLEDTSFVSKITASPFVTSQYAYYKARLLWEKKINGKVAIMEAIDTRHLTGIKKVDEPVVSYSLYQNYPNPFNPVTKIKFDIPYNLSFQRAPSWNPVVSLKVYDITGREIQTLVNEQLQPGTYEVTFDGSNFASGVYFYQLRAGEFAVAKKLVLLK